MAYTKDLSDGEAEFRPGIVHRIDKDTSGLILIAKNNIMHEELSKMFKAHTIKREYIALLIGELPHNTMTIDAPIGRDTKDRKRMAVVAVNGRKAITEYEVLERYGKFTIVRCNLLTGRTHQIRLHMEYIGHPIVNDPVYGKKKLIDEKFGQMLHAEKIGFVHPTTKEYMEFTAPVPDRFKEILEGFR